MLYRTNIERDIIRSIVLSSTKVLEYNNRGDLDRSKNKFSLVNKMLSYANKKLNKLC